MTVFDYIYELITQYFLPAETAFPEWNNIVIVICAVISLAIFWVWILRPFWWFFKYGLWGGSKKQKRLNKWND